MNAIKRAAILGIARQYNLNTPEKEAYFDVLWEVFKVGNRYKNRQEENIERDLRHNYRCIAAAILDKDIVEFINPVNGIVSRDFSNNNVFERIKTLTLNDTSGKKQNNPFVVKPGMVRRPSVADSMMRRPDRSTSMTRPVNTVGLSKYVIFSDHHITPLNDSHNYFSEGQNKELYMEVLNYYGDNDFGLIENGDVEEYTIFEPTPEIINRYDNLVDRSNSFGSRPDIGSIRWADLNEERINNRINILTRILDEHSDLYAIINEKFAQKGEQYYTKITGNHDPYINSRLLDVLPDFLRDNLCDGLRLTKGSGMRPDEVKYFVTHGHQFDTSTLPQHAFAIGEVFSEKLGWCIQGADRIWDVDKTNQWRNPELNSSFRNVLATADAEVLETQGLIQGGSEGIFEMLMQNHEIAWEYFDSQRITDAVRMEVLTGDEYFKVRHLSESRLVQSLNRIQMTTELSNYREPTKLIIGHTHEPRLNSRAGVNNDDVVTNYINSGSAGRFDNLIWGVELIDGEEKVISWTNIGSEENMILRRDQWISTGDGRFEKTEYPL